MTGTICNAKVQYSAEEYLVIPAPKGTMGNYRKHFTTKELPIHPDSYSVNGPMRDVTKPWEGYRVKFEIVALGKETYAKILRIEKKPKDIFPNKEKMGLIKAHLIERSKNIELLEAYSKFLEDRNYMDSDWRDEEPYAIDEFLKTQK